MAATGIPGAGLSGVLRMTLVQDQLAHVLDHCDVDEPTGTWTGLACPAASQRTSRRPGTARLPS